MPTTDIGTPPSTYPALVLRDDNDRIVAELERVPQQPLADREVLIRIAYSSVNYKDGLLVCGRRRAARYPMVPGIDLAGVVESSRAPEIAVGSPVIVTGFGAGETRPGGYAGYVQVPADWLVPLPASLSLSGAMTIGTAGLTAALALMLLEERGLTPAAGPVLVTGATGGVGSFAIALFAGLGFEVVAVSGRAATETGYLSKLGAASVVDRARFLTTWDGRRLAGAIDGIGGALLSTVLTRLDRERAVVALGRAGGDAVSLSLEPFILRGVAMIGLDSVHCPQTRRALAWERLGRVTTPALLQQLTTMATLEDVPRLAPRILAGELRGRTVIRIDPPEH